MGLGSRVLGTIVSAGCTLLVGCTVPFVMKHLRMLELNGHVHQLCTHRGLLLISSADRCWILLHL